MGQMGNPMGGPGSMGPMGNPMGAPGPMGQMGNPMGGAGPMGQMGNPMSMAPPSAGMGYPGMGTPNPTNIPAQAPSRPAGGGDSKLFEGLGDLDLSLSLKPKADDKP